MITFEIIIGAALALGLLFLPINKQHLQIKIWSFALILAAIIYVGFALLASNREWLPTELVGVLIYSIPAFLALKYNGWWLVLGWIAHVLWDIGLHTGGHPGFVPSWYPGVCIGFDLAVAGYFAYKIWNKKIDPALKQV